MKITWIIVIAKFWLVQFFNFVELGS